MDCLQFASWEPVNVEKLYDVCRVSSHPITSSCLGNLGQACYTFNHWPQGCGQNPQ